MRIISHKRTMSGHIWQAIAEASDGKRFYGDSSDYGRARSHALFQCICYEKHDIALPCEGSPEGEGEGEGSEDQPQGQPSQGQPQGQPEGKESESYQTEESYK